MSDDWLVEEGAFGSRMVMKGPWSREALTFVRESGIRDLLLNYAQGWVGNDVSFLTELADVLVALTIIHRTIEDVSAVNALRRLRYLDVNTYCKTEIQFSNFPMLEDCKLEWRSRARSLFEHTGIKSLFINKYPDKDLRTFDKMRSLESLRLASPKIETLAGVTALDRLTMLCINRARRLQQLDGLEQLTNLVHLELNDCRKITNISALANLVRLRELQLCNDGEIDSFRPLAGMKDLRVLLFYESTNVLDGDLNVLKELPNLKLVALMDRRHYSHKRTEFPHLPHHEAIR